VSSDIGGLFTVRKVISGLFVLAGMILLGGCLGQAREQRATPTSMDVLMPTATGVLAPTPLAPTTPTPSLPPAPISGHPAPDFTLPDLGGDSLRLSDFRGRVVLLVFWATWCPACRAQMPAIRNAYEELEDQGFVAIGVNMREDSKHVVAFVKEHRLNFPVAIDNEGRVIQRYRVWGVPSNFLIDREGIVQRAHVGQISDAMIREWVGELL